MKDKVKFIKDLAKSINTYSVDSVEYENEDFKIKIKKNREEKTKTVYTMNDSQAMLNMNNNNVHNQAEVVESKPVVEEITGIKIESPMVGTYYSAPSPDSAPFVKEGEKVQEGDTLCIIEAMKLMNDIKAPISRIIKKVYVKDGTTIKKSDVLMIIE